MSQQTKWDYLEIPLADIDRLLIERLPTVGDIAKYAPPKRSITQIDYHYPTLNKTVVFVYSYQDIK